MLIVLRHCWGEQAQLDPPQTPPVMLRTCKSLGLSLQHFKLWFLYFWCYHCHISAFWSMLVEQSNAKLHLLPILLLFPCERMGGEHLEMSFFLWLMWPHGTSNPSAASCVSALPDLLVQLLSNSSKKPAWKAVDLVFLENMVLREGVGDLKCLRVCKDKEQIKKKQNKQFNGDGAVAPARRGCGRASILSRCTRWFLTTEGQKQPHCSVLEDSFAKSWKCLVSSKYLRSLFAAVRGQRVHTLANKHWIVTSDKNQC